MDEKIRCLVISYFYYPFNSSSSRRIYKLIKNLPSSSVEPIILTANWRYFLKKGINKIENISSNIRVYYAFSLDPFYLSFIWKTSPISFFIHLINKRNKKKAEDHGVAVGRRKKWKSFVKKMMSFPDSQILWAPFAIFKAVRIIKINNVKIILASGGPWTNLVIGWIVSKICKIKLVIDYQDLWSLLYLNPLSRIQQRFSLALERKIWNRAHGIIMLNEYLIEKQLKYFPKDDKVIISLPIGFEINKIYDNKIGTSPSLLKILYAGVFYHDRKPDIFLEALHLAKKLNKDINIKFIFAGIDYEGRFTELVEKYNLLDSCTCKGFLPEGQVETLARQSDLLLLIISPYYIEEYTGKLFDYISYNKPILAVVPSNGAAANFIKKARVGFVVPHDALKLKQEIIKIWNLKKENMLLYNPNYEFLNQFSTNNLSRKLVEFLNTVLNI